MPVTQIELADTVGMTSVHVNRTLQELREKELLVWRGKLLTITDLDGLQRFAGFDSSYLHLVKRKAA